MHEEISKLLMESASELCRYLSEILPTFSSDWWKDGVLSMLTPPQARRVEQNRISSLQGLDLAALLRVFDQNWFRIAEQKKLAPEIRHYVKEMQTIRNRWSHSGTTGYDNDDIYRDLDTLQRFATAIEASPTFIQTIRQGKSSLLARSNGATPVALQPAVAPQPSEHVETETKTIISGQTKPMTEFKVGDIVALRTNPDLRGAVLLVIPATPETRYNVFINNGMQSYYASQLLAIQAPAEDRQFLSVQQFQAYLSALQIRHPSLSTLYSLNAARVDFIPYQFRPVLKFMRSDRPRLLIADSVGVGKTIEAGLILRELQARREVRSVLIICPRPLVTERKWQLEMKRFEERFTQLDGQALRYCINEMDLEGVWPDQHQKTILPYSLFDENLLHGSTNGRRGHQKGLLELDPPPRFDLVIVDEAHHIRNSSTFAHQAVRFFCDNAEAVVFLTATPIQLGSDDLYVLLNLLRPDLIIDRDSFEAMAAPNAYINDAVSAARTVHPDWALQTQIALAQAAATHWGQAILRHTPEFHRVMTLLAESNLTPEQRINLITAIEGLHTFAGIINRTRRRDIGDFTTRKSETVHVEFTTAQQNLHDALLRTQADILSFLHDDQNVKFMMTTLRRQAASCLYGLAPLIDDILTRKIDELLWGDEETMGMDGPGLPISLENQIYEVLHLAKQLDSTDPKLNAVKKILDDKQQMINNKVMLFSSFRHTLSYLFTHLSKDKYRIGLIHGGIQDEERVELRDRFKLDRQDPHALDVLLFSEVGCEGLDYQFCDCMVNYDLPWNPMRLEQRIGRIDRNGQKSESVAIYNLITPGTVDAEIYERCLLRIGIFNKALGGNEEILGKITREIRDIAENFRLSTEERQQKLQQLADNQIRLIQEQERLEEQQADLFGIRLPAEQMKKEIDDASSYWLTADAIRNLVVHYLQKISDNEQEYILGEKEPRTLRLSQPLREALLIDFQKLPRQTSPTSRDWELWLKGSNPHLSITFDQKVASQQPQSAFITPLHPLVRQAAAALEINQKMVTAVEVVTEQISPGAYPFAVYQWQFHGIRESLQLRTISMSPQISDIIGELLAKSKGIPDEEAQILTSQLIDQLEESHYTLWQEARSKHIERTKEIARYRHQSLETSHRARVALLQEQLAQATNEKIQRMRRSQIDTAEVDFARRAQDLDLSIERADVTAQPIAFGVLKVSEVKNAK